MRVLVLALGVLALSACASAKAGYGGLKPGVTKDQVIMAMDACPTSVVDRGRYEAMTYSNRMLSFFQWEAATYTFILRDGVLVQFGEGTAVATVTNAEPSFELKPPVKG
jgi:hypothetical protein